MAYDITIMSNIMNRKFFHSCLFKIVLLHPISLGDRNPLALLGVKLFLFVAFHCLLLFSATKTKSLKEDWIAYICREVLTVSSSHQICFKNSITQHQVCFHIFSKQHK